VTVRKAVNAQVSGSPALRSPSGRLHMDQLLVERFLDSNHISGSTQMGILLVKRHFPARQHMIGFKESLY
jgi:hypothetical protein